MGELDLVRDAVAQLGEILFHGVAIKPGKPTLLAQVRGTPVLGMPGYPTSCLSNGYIFLAPAIDKLARRPPSIVSTLHCRAAADLKGAPDKLQVLTVQLTDQGALPAFKGSGAITSLSHADGYVRIPPGTELVPQGAEIEVSLL